MLLRTPWTHKYCGKWLPDGDFEKSKNKKEYSDYVKKFAKKPQGTSDSWLKEHQPFWVGCCQRLGDEESDGKVQVLWYDNENNNLLGRYSPRKEVIRGVLMCALLAGSGAANQTD